MLDELDLAWEDDETRRRRGASSGRNQRRRKKRKGRSGGALFISIVLLLVLGGGVYWGVGQIQENQSIKEFLAADYGQGDMGDEVTYTVKDGDGGTATAIGLLKADIVKSRTAFVNVCNDNDADCKAIQPGSYKVHKHSPAKVVFDILKDPKNKLSNTFTVPEGLSVIQTLAKLAVQTGIPLADFQDAIKDPTKLGITPDMYTREDGKGSVTTVGHPEALVEGFLFPDTYNYDAAATATDILKQMVDQYKQVATDVGLEANAQRLGLTPYELLVTASLAQDEAGNGTDFAKVARVVYNRVVVGKIECGCLQFDSAENYWLELNGKPTKNSGDMTAAELNDPTNPYNTHASDSGLPIGPISSPGKDALNGAANPAAGNWIYFVATDTNGTTAFASTWSEFCSAKSLAVQNGLNLDLSDC
jgi:peptidoglycan lytic transglycosylase G